MSKAYEQAKKDGFSMKNKNTNGKTMVLKCKAQEPTTIHWFYNNKNIGTNEKALALLKKAQEPTKTHWLYKEKHRNQRKSTGLTVTKLRNQ